ncbi:MAG TPA: exopolysaccharide biosynthesis protein [Rhizomicrobium sp.]|nr:exopolysaccharide biosynthesis protein [Rhizomicrobium sp.]
MQTSRALERLLDEAPADRINVAWIAAQLESRSFGFVMLVLALAGLAPGIASVSGFLLAVPSLQMIAGRRALALPAFLSKRSASTAGFAKWVRRLIPVFAAVERIVPSSAHGRLLRATRLIGAIDLLLAIAIIVPVPFAYIPPTLAIVAISFAQIEDSVALLAIALMIAALAICFVGLVSWELMAFLVHAIGL